MNDPELDALASRVGQQLAARGWMMAAAESCTGGWVAQTVTAIAGSSAWFERGFVTYSNAAKESLLGVTAAALERHGAVSEEVAAAMAGGALANSRAHVALAVTGVAGPGGGSPAKPVGMVCFGWIAAAGPARTETRIFDGDRTAVRRQSVIHALTGLLALLADSR
ncbi:MAG: nicotinamide-nucleotide amidohydrolase family protein [Burkholderiales bacterium]|nr:nicotinamide-nucleotide amidohydrolase family protein [Burkholderiales bacterium]